MTQFEEKLSAYLDGELSGEAAREIEAALASDPDLQAEMDMLVAAETGLRDAFAKELAKPVPSQLIEAIESVGPAIQPANIVTEPSFFGQLTKVAAALVLLAIGGAAGFMAAQNSAGPSPRSWLAEISEYHGVYAAQERHLVEVSANETAHLQTWLTNSIGVDVVAPDLSDLGLNFEGGRLVVAAGKPVGQLMYRDQDGAVIALCMIATNAPREGFLDVSLNGFDMVSWGQGDTNYVLIGDGGRPNLRQIAERAADRV